ncbi:formate--tetrahydrofolate ligase [Treponema sp. OMZ 840]|uniref:formate--tetrahydrofolate ligase n=1 Tax=Treponema sp. OMZ 840 TaxID=244313 RepID=UPI003D924119
MLSDIEIAHSRTMENVHELAQKLGLQAADYELYGTYKAKINLKTMYRLMETPANKRGKLILVSALTPTAAGEGKSTVSIALADGLRKIGKKAVLALREPSLGPCFGIKGGACGGGYAQIVPMEDINLHFTGDIHAVSAANNLIAALIDNHIQQGNALNLDPRSISWRRCLDLNDRTLRNVLIGLGGTADGVLREEHFDIAVASEIMAILCLSKSIDELKNRLGNIFIGKTYAKEPVYLKQLGAEGAAAALLKDALRPNLVQTLEHTPAFVHGGPFANIAHGCNSINATLCALALGDYTVTEAGFAADLGAEKFMDIKCRLAGIAPDAAVIVATVRALKMHGGVSKADLEKPNPAAMLNGFENLRVHIENMSSFGVPVVVAVNRFSGDTEEELQALFGACRSLTVCGKDGTPAVLCEGWAKGGDGAADLARTVAALCDSASARFTPLYKSEDSFTDKIEKIARNIYRASRVEFSPAALKKIKEYTAAGWAHLPVCIAKTQNSISHDKNLLGAPSGYVFPVRDVLLKSGAGFLTVLAGDMMTMPGLPKIPAACSIDVDNDGHISGLF